LPELEQVGPDDKMPERNSTPSRPGILRADNLRRIGLLITVARLRDQNLIVRSLVNNLMFRIDSPQPVAFNACFSGTGLPSPLDPPHHLGVRLVPTEITFPRLRPEDEIRTSSFSLRLTPLPRFRTASALMSRLALAREVSRPFSEAIRIRRATTSPLPDLDFA
jgi:hypothetical protein